jgi:hypothetical protein
MLVLMAVVTTLATTPTLALLGVEEDPARVAQSGEVRSRAAK